MMISGTLYIVATPIGNLQDITFRAIEILKKVDYIAAEDTRHTRQMLTHYGLHNHLISLHDYNEEQRLKKIFADLKNNKNIALVSDAGTPLISDPGYSLVRFIREQGGKVVPIPGACAAIAALMVSGLPTDHFVFEGFLPHKSSARLIRLQELSSEPRTIVFYESVHRIIETLKAMYQVFGEERLAVLARELTKKFETIQSGSFNALIEHFDRHSDQVKGEFVILVKGVSSCLPQDTIEVNRILEILLQELPTKQAVKLTAKIFNNEVNKKELYQLALEKKKDSNSNL